MPPAALEHAMEPAPTVVALTAKELAPEAVGQRVPEAVEMAAVLHALQDVATVARHHAREDVPPAALAPVEPAVPRTAPAVPDAEEAAPRIAAVHVLADVPDAADVTISVMLRVSSHARDVPDAVDARCHAADVAEHVPARARQTAETHAKELVMAKLVRRFIKGGRT